MSWMALSVLYCPNDLKKKKYFINPINNLYFINCFLVFLYCFYLCEALCVTCVGKMA